MSENPEHPEVLVLSRVLENQRPHLSLLNFIFGDITVWIHRIETMLLDETSMRYDRKNVESAQIRSLREKLALSIKENKILREEINSVTIACEWMG